VCLVVEGQFQSPRQQVEDDVRPLVGVSGDALVRVQLEPDRARATRLEHFGVGPSVQIGECRAFRHTARYGMGFRNRRPELDRERDSDRRPQFLYLVRVARDMPDHVLVPFDGTPHAETALSFAATEWPDASLTLLYVVDPVTAGFTQRALPGSSETWYENARETAREQFASARDRVDRPVETRIDVGSPARVVVDVASEDPFDHVVIGSHGREGVSRILLGSVAEGVVRRSPVPVTVVR